MSDICLLVPPAPLKLSDGQTLSFSGVMSEAVLFRTSWRRDAASVAAWLTFIRVMQTDGPWPLQRSVLQVIAAHARCLDGDMPAMSVDVYVHFMRCLHAIDMALLSPAHVDMAEPEKASAETAPTEA